MCYLAGYDENGSYDGEDGGKHDASRVSIYAACHFRTESETYYVCEEGVDAFEDGHNLGRRTEDIDSSTKRANPPTHSLRLDLLEGKTALLIQLLI